MYWHLETVVLAMLLCIATYSMLTKVASRFRSYAGQRDHSLAAEWSRQIGHSAMRRTNISLNADAFL